MQSQTNECDSYQKQEEGRNKIFPQTSGSVAMKTAWFLTSGPYNCGKKYAVVSSHPVFGNLLQQPQKTNTAFFFIMMKEKLIF